MDLNVVKEIRLPDQLFDARFHPASDKDLVAVTSVAGDVHIIEGKEVKQKLQKHHKGSSIRRVRFFNDGRLVTIAKTAKVHDLTTNQTLHTLKRDDGKPTVFYSVKPFGSSYVSAGDDDGGVFVWDLRTPDAPIFSSYDCDQYISDIDGKFETRRVMMCSSGEGTLTAYDLRANKKIEPQSELFEAGFQCLKYVDHLKKVVIGGEDGALFVFNNNEWAHTSGKFAISSDLQNRGKCSIDCLDILSDNSTFLAGCSDGRVRSVSLWPHRILSETKLCKRNSIESIHVKPGTNQFIVSGGNYINLVEIQEASDEEEEDKGDKEVQRNKAATPSSGASTLSDDDDDDDDDADSESVSHTAGDQEKLEPSNQNRNKKFKGDERNSEDDEKEDYLNVFK